MMFYWERAMRQLTPVVLYRIDILSFLQQIESLIDI